MRTQREAIAAGIPQRWYEARLPNRAVYVSVWEWPWWALRLWLVLVKPIFEALICAGILELEEYGDYRDVRIAPLGTRPQPWSYATPKPWWLRWVHD